MLTPPPLLSRGEVREDNSMIWCDMVWYGMIWMLTYTVYERSGDSTDGNGLINGWWAPFTAYTFLYSKFGISISTCNKTARDAWLALFTWRLDDWGSTDGFQVAEALETLKLKSHRRWVLSINCTWNLGQWTSFCVYWWHTMWQCHDAGVAAGGESISRSATTCSLRR